MLKQFNKDIQSAYFDEIYDFKGQWDVPSRCGIKIVYGSEHSVIIATELYAENPGTSVTNFCVQLATRLCNQRNINPEKLIFIVRTPDTQSKLTFMNEDFFRVKLTWNGESFQNPCWEQISKDKVDEFIGNK
ncbi:MAG: hypothetical protein PHR81_03790 [Bacteroidales bacterium]|jgi:hypothetical protein|nr:hypothetical protein [Bacteroidales bacterium]MDD4213912.1 hypothetical protein [Bacteroidales bacterium]